MSKTHKEILSKANEAIARGGFEGFLLHCTDETVWNFLGEKTLKGKEAPKRKPTARSLLPSSLHAAARLPPLDEVIVVLALVPRFGHPCQAGIAQQSLIGLRPE
jgi:hypothetical protein